VSSSRFPFIRPSLPEPDEWVPFLAPAYESGRFSNFGPVATIFESEIATRVPARACVGVANATLGLTAALLALRAQGPVVLPSFTFPGTVHAVTLAGCRPAFCEVDAETWELDPNTLSRLVAEQKPAAVIHVRAFGLCRDLTPIEEACAGVPLIVDAAAAMGGSVDGARWIGGSGVCEVFSLHATKAFAIGEGGLVVGEPGLVEEVRRVVNFSLLDSDVMGPGLNAKLDEFAAARALAMLRRLGPALEARSAGADRYREALDAGLVLHPARPGQPPWQTYPVRLTSPELRTPLVEALARYAIEARPYYTPALHRTTAFRTDQELPVTDLLSASVLCLPVYPDASDSERNELTSSVRGALEDVLVAN
jgi:dTDP-4-amino-4,6-dideoxygalactose transaminase